MSNLEFGEKVDRHCPGDETTLRNHLGEVGGNICPVCWKVYDIPSEPSPTTQPKVIDMIEKLKQITAKGSGVVVLDNDDIREIIQRLEQAEVMQEALEYVSESPLSGWTITQGIARNALNQTKLP